MINKIDKTFKVKHRAVSYIVGTIILIIFLILFIWFFQIIIVQINGLIGNIMANWDRIIEGVNSWVAKITDEIQLLPSFVNNAIQSGLRAAYDFLIGLQKDAVNITLNFTSAFINTSSSAIFFAITFLVAYYIILGEMKKASYRYNELFGESFKNNISIFSQVFKNSTWNYIKAQLKLAFLCFVLMAISFKIIGQQYLIPIALLVGFCDLLPMIGPVIVMIPWSLAEFLIFGNSTKGIAVLVLYLVWQGIRQVLAPKIIGQSADIHPLLSVIALYAGLKLWGVVGAIMGPILMIFVVGIIKSGLLDNWIYDYREFFHHIKDLLNIGKRKLNIPED